jgi:hypothetical protein
MLARDSLKGSGAVLINAYVRTGNADGIPPRRSLPTLRLV